MMRYEIRFAGAEVPAEGRAAAAVSGKCHAEPCRVLIMSYRFQGSAFVAPKSLIESSRRNAIYARKLGIQHDLLIANRQNSDVRSFVSHSSNRRILSFAPVHSSRRYQLFVDYSQDAVSICDLIFHIRRRVATMTVPLN